MKTHKSILSLAAVIILMIIHISCEQQKVDPALVLDEVFIPEGYRQVDEPPSDALARLEELRLNNSSDHYYYLQRNDFNAEKWLFPQKELKIEYISRSDGSGVDGEPMVIGVVVKKIRENWKNEVFMVVDQQPTPKGGLNAFYHYIQENLKYPEEAKEMGVEGKVFVQFIVEPTGKLTEIQAVKGIGAGCDEEAVRVLEIAEAWNPATVADLPVKTRMILPITYKLDSKEKSE
jgi:TonB family protein